MTAFVLTHAGCGPSLTDAERVERLRESWPGVYDRAVVSSSERGFLEFRGNGQLIRYALNCSNDVTTEDSYDWEIVSPDLIEVRVNDATEKTTQLPGDVYTTVMSNGDECGPHEMSYTASNTVDTLSKGALCPDNIQQTDAGPTSCDWVPCDEVAMRCRQGDANEDG